MDKLDLSWLQTDVQFKKTLSILQIISLINSFESISMSQYATKTTTTKKAFLRFVLLLLVLLVLCMSLKRPMQRQIFQDFSWRRENTGKELLVGTVRISVGRRFFIPLFSVLRH